jgi:AraC-like DNA-binding protein
LGIALDCGFGSTSHLYHAYKRVFGIAPTDERRQTAPRRVSRSTGDSAKSSSTRGT